MFLFDTDIISNLFKKRPTRNLVERIGRLDRSKQFISTITVAEIVYGARKGPNPEKHLLNLEKLLLPAINVLDFDLRAAYIAGEIRAGLEKRGKPLSFTDIQIAAIALSNQLILITGNTGHFTRIPALRVENWLGAQPGNDR
ncbi:MAG: PIN domain-containing protein [Candidatus Erginobacter occultus]|nr:PIN domain-containing protein [Candidatus Erginobacter occultus]